MKTMPPRSPSRRSSPPPPPRISHRSPGFRSRGRSPDRRRRLESQGGGGRGMSPPPRSRERREFNRPSPRSHADFPLPRRSRSPIRDAKRRSFSPKRKLSPKRERERERVRDPERERPPRGAMSRKRSRSKTPPGAVGPVREGPRMGPYNVGPGEVSPGRVYQGPPDPYPGGIPVLDVQHRTLGSLGERFRATSGGNYEEERTERPVFRGPDGSGFDINELKKITVDIRRNLPVSKGPPVERNIINPEDVVVVRRPASEEYSYRRKGEGSRPIFARDEIMQANERTKYEPGPYEHRSGPMDEHHRVVAIVDNAPAHQSTGPRFESPGRYPGPSVPSHSRDPYYSGSAERDYGRSREYDRSHGPPPNFDSRDKVRDDRFDRRDDLRHDLELRRRDDTRYPSHGDNVRTYEKGRDYRGDSERGSSDLRMRINEKRTDRHDDREPGHRIIDHREGIERDRSRDRRMRQPSPPGDRRRGPPPMDEFGHSPEDNRKPRGDGRRIPPMSHHGPGGPGGRHDEQERFHHPEQPPGEFGGHQRPDRFHPPNKPWDVDPEYVPKGPYFEHDNRMPNPRGRGMMGPRGMMRGRGIMRGRPFRGAGPSRGFMRGTGRRGGYSPRGFYNIY